MQIAEIARRTGCAKIIYISGIPIIGKPKVIPITEEHSIEPPSVYHASKIFGEYVFNLLVQEGINVINLRLPSPIGADMPAGKIFSVFVEKCLKNEDISLLGKGGRMQNYIDTDDIAQAIYRSISYNKSATFNIAANKSYSNLELATICKNVLSSNSNISFNGKEDLEEDCKWIVSIDKARREIDFEPIVSIEESILNRKRYYENNLSK